MTRRATLTEKEIVRLLKAVKSQGWEAPELTLHANGSVTVRNCKKTDTKDVDPQPPDTQGDGSEIVL